MNNIGTKLIGTGRCIPDQILTNQMLEQMVDTSDDWIVKRTGIHQRHIAREQATWELGLEAAKHALENSNISAEQLDLILVATVTPDFYTPSVGCMIQGKLGAHQAMALDLSAACSGFVYAMEIADSFIKSAKAQYVLIVCAETLSRIVDYTDRGTCVIFGDGAGAAVLQAGTDEADVLSTYMRADGVLGECLKACALPKEDPFAESRATGNRFLFMDGNKVFRFTAAAVPEAIDGVLQKANICADEIDWFVLHQANERILRMITTRYGLDAKKVYMNIDRFGNTSGASIPICLDEMNRNGQLHTGQKIVLCGFGGGLTYGAVLMRI